MNKTPSETVTRLAPSPTGLLHLGNAWSFLLAWLGARSCGGKVLLRVEDLDPARSKPEFCAALEQDLLWLGLDWDGQPLYQSRRGQLYETALDGLRQRHLAYPCYCTRKELRAAYDDLQGLAAAPHQPVWGDAGAAYSGACRKLNPAQRAEREAMGRHPAWRLAGPPEPFAFTDLVFGPQSYALAQLGGDFALRRSDGVWAYQLAVCVDDAAMGVNLVVRGQDLLSSTPRQLCLLELMGQEAPRYAHLPLLLDAEGQRLAKRHQSLSLAALRQAGLAPEAVIGFLAHLAGWGHGPCTPRQLAERLQGEGGLPWAHLCRPDIRLEAFPLP